MTAHLQTKPFDAAQFLDTDEAVAAFLTDALESGDSAVFQEAMQIAARARGMTEVAKSAGLGRESLYKALQSDALPRFATVYKVLDALGVKLTFSAACPAKAPAKAVKKRVVVKRVRKPRGGEFAVVAAPRRLHRAKAAG